MKKIILVLFFFMATCLLTSCDEVVQVKELSDDVITKQIEAVINAKSYETRMHFRMKTDEIELSVNPLVSFQKFTDDDEKEVYRIHYYNKIMEGSGLQAFELIVDERDEAVYINNSKAWYKGTFDEIEEEAGEPIFGYLFDLNNQLDDEKITDIESIQEILINGMKNFNDATFVDVVKDDNRELIHYELEYNVYNILKEVFEYINAKYEESESEYDDFEEFISQLEITDIVDIFKKFTIDVYFDTADNSLGRIELDLMNILNNDIILDKIEEEIDDEDIDINTIFEYMSDFEIGINIYNLNTLAEITVPNEAKYGYPLDILNGPFNPEDLIEINVGDTVQAELTAKDEIWYTFIIEETQDINITRTGLDGVYVSYSLYGSNGNYLSSDTNVDNTYTYNNLPPGRYYLEISGYADNVEYIID